MRLPVAPRRVQGWVGGLVEGAESDTLPPGTITEGENFVPTPAGRLRTRGGSRIVQTLRDDAGSPAVLSHVCTLAPFTNVGALAIGWSDGQNKHYAYRLTSDMAFTTGVESTSRVDLTAAPSTTWDNASSPARPNCAEVWEKMFIADADTTYANRNEMLAIDSAGTVTRRTFVFGAGAAAAPAPYCIEEYNGVLFMAGYGTEDAGDSDRPEYLRHSFLGRSPDASDGFDADAWAIIGSKGQRITALRKGRGLLLVAKDSEFHRVTGYGRAYGGWQYQIEQVENTQGLGVTNPNALTFAEGYWWGVSAQGPIRSDGFSVELLVGPRRRSWVGINQTSRAWVAYHPERRLVLFGLHPSEAVTGRSTTYPWRVWAWDTTRDVWQPDHTYGADLFFASPVVTTTAQGPSAAPSGGTTSAATSGGYTASWTNGDATAETEFWEKEGTGGTWTLVTVIAAGTATYARTGRTNYTTYYWRVRHRTTGVGSAYNSTVGILAQTLIAPPSLTAAQAGTTSLIQLDLIQNAGGTNVVVERSVNSGAFATWNTYTARAAGAFTVYDLSQPCGVTLDYRTRATDAGWSVTESAYETAATIDLTSGCTDE